MARLQLDLSQTHNELVTKLMDLCDLRTKKDVVENALMLLGWAAKEAQRGSMIAAVDESSQVYREVEIPALLGARATAQRGALRPPLPSPFVPRDEEEDAVPSYHKVA